MSITKTQPMRSAEIDLIDVCNGFSSDIASIEAQMETLQTDIATLQEDMTETQGDVTSLESDVTSLESDVTSVQESVAAVQEDMTEMQSDVASLESDVTDVISALDAFTTLETVDYTEYISVASNSGVTVSSATLKKWGKLCLLNVNYSIASANAIASGNWKNIFDIVGPHAPVTGFPVAAAVNDKSAAAMLNNTNALWIKAYNAAHSGSHYVGLIYLTN